MDSGQQEVKTDQIIFAIHEIDEPELIQRIIQQATARLRDVNPRAARGVPVAPPRPAPVVYQQPASPNYWPRQVPPEPETVPPIRRSIRRTVWLTTTILSFALFCGGLFAVLVAPMIFTAGMGQAVVAGLSGNNDPAQIDAIAGGMVRWFCGSAVVFALLFYFIASRLGWFYDRVRAENLEDLTIAQERALNRRQW